MQTKRFYYSALIIQVNCYHLLLLRKKRIKRSQRKITLLKTNVLINFTNGLVIYRSRYGQSISKNFIA